MELNQHSAPESGTEIFISLETVALVLSFRWSPTKCLIGALASEITSTLPEPPFCILISPEGKQCSSVKRLDSVSPTSYYYYKSYYLNETGIHVLENLLCWQKLKMHRNCDHVTIIASVVTLMLFHFSCSLLIEQPFSVGYKSQWLY